MTLIVGLCVFAFLPVTICLPSSQALLVVNFINLSLFRFCPNDEWRLPKHLNCSNNDCPVVEAILDYAKDNLVMFNIFIKDPYAKRFMKDEKITKTAYIANSGGLLGICLLLTFLTDNFVFALFILIGFSLLLGLVL